MEILKRLGLHIGQLDLNQLSRCLFLREIVAFGWKFVADGDVGGSKVIRTSTLWFRKATYRVRSRHVDFVESA